MRYFFSRRDLSMTAMTLALLGALAAPAPAQQGTEFTITITSTETVDAAGNIHMQGVTNFNPPRGNAS